MAYNTEKFRDYYRTHLIPHYYSGILHLLFSACCSLIAISLFLSFLSELVWLDLLIVPPVFLLGGLVVFLLHKYPLHRPIPGMTFAYRIHTLYHHKFFTDQHITWGTTKDFHIVFFPAMAALGINAVVCPLIYWAVSSGFGTNAGFLAAATASGYFLLYESIHFCSHLEAHHPVLRLGYLRKMRQHHIIHHDPSEMNKTNFNIVCPFWDLVLGTYKK